MSARRFCAAVDDVCDNVPSSPPKSLCPRLRSSVAVAAFLGGRAASGWSSLLRRRRLVPFSDADADELRLFWPASGEAGSGTATAEARVLKNSSALMSVKLRAAKLTLLPS